MYGLRTMFLVVLMAGLLMVVGFALAGEIGLIRDGSARPRDQPVQLLQLAFDGAENDGRPAGNRARRRPICIGLSRRAACQAKMPFQKALLEQFTVEHLEARAPAIAAR